MDYYYFDGLGSTVMLGPTNASVSDRYDYEPWGEVTHLSGTTADNPYQYVGQLGYYNHWMDSSLSDLLHLGVRFYEPGVGRFGQGDPLALESVAEMCYANDSPISTVDPDGLKCRKYNKGHRLQTCWKALDKCAASYPFYDRAKKRVGDRIYMCDGTGRYFWEPKEGGAYGDSRCWKSGKGWDCEIRFFEARVFPNGGMGELCPTLLHELLHCGNWPRSDGKQPGIESIVENAAQYMWDYLCDKSSSCYGAKPKDRPSDWGTVLGWIVN